MTAKELLRQRIDELSEAEAESALRLIDAQRKGAHTSEADEPEMAPLPRMGRDAHRRADAKRGGRVSRSRDTH